MTKIGEFDDIEVTLDAHVALIEIQRPPHNFFDHALAPTSQLPGLTEKMQISEQRRSRVVNYMLFI